MNEIQQSGFIYATIMLVAGIGIPIMAALNAELGIRLQSPGTASSFISCRSTRITYLSGHS